MSFAHFQAYVQERDSSPIWALFVCLHCDKPLLISLLQVRGTQEKHEVIDVHPRGPGRRFPDASNYELIPTELRGALEQAYAALGVGAFTLAGLGCRVVLERFVQGHGHRESNIGLEERLERLKGSFPDLVPALINADAIRLVGNVAAHDAYRELNQAEAEAVIDFTEDVLRASYIAPARRRRIESAFANRREESRGGPPKP